MSAVDDVKRPVAVVIQTHWDREWYFPHQTFVARLILVMERVVTQLESGKLQQFLFDGQTAAYEDLLANAEPTLVSRVKALVHAKRIVLGPWYVMADEFLVSGESLLRNLEIGIGDALAAGNCQYVGYLPDTFGHIGQIPQLLANFNIQSAVIWRGVDSPVAEFDWQSPDGTRVGAIFLTQGYYQHPLNVMDWQAALARYLDSVASRSLSAELLLTQGGDHLLTVDAAAARIETFNQTNTTYQLVEKSLAAHVDTVLAETAGRRHAVHGALRNNKQAFVLPDVLSTRRYLKRLNQDAEDRLLGVIEPLLVQLAIDDYPTRYLQDTWRMVIQQQAHDSICGCSVDEVHQEMVTRYLLIDQRLKALMDRAATAGGLVSAEQHQLQVNASPDVFADDARFTLFNSLPIAFVGSQIISLFLRGEKRSALSLKTLAVESSTGQALQCELIGVQPDAVLRSPIDDFPERLEGHRYEVLVRCEIPGLDALACVVEDAATAPLSPASDSMATKIENQRYRIFLNDDGELSITNRLTGQTLASALSFVSELDAGDSYNFSPPPNQHRVAQTKYSLVSCLMLTGMQELVLAVSLTTPQSLSADRAGRSDEMVANTGLLRIRLFADGANETNIDFSLDWKNRASDQRTRLMLALPAPVEHTFSDAGFEWVRHPVKYANYPTSETRQEMPVVVNPSLSAIVAGDLVFLHYAMHEYEVLQVNGEQMLGVTLVRSVGWMSRRDLVTRGVGAGPDLETPDAQCLGNEGFVFQIALGSGGAHPLELAQRFRRPLVCLRGATSKWAGSVEVDNPVLQISAVRRVGAYIELRVWNPTDIHQQFALSSGEWHRVTADGSPSAAAVDVVKPHEIVTLRCRR
jgi:hypothetical protein